jgi:hypothetical protein
VIVDLPSPLVVVCHDAGAANIICSWLAHEPREVRPVMSGPALAIWCHQFPDRKFMTELPEAFSGAAAVLSGTGWSSALEHDARCLARRLKLRSVAVIDHWVNYAMRFERRGTVCLPDELWVTDIDAERIALDAFDLPVVLKPNPYFDGQIAAAGPPPTDGDVLFLCEPARSDWGRGVPGEFQALDYFMAHRGVLGIGPKVAIRLRPHPSEDPHKYDRWLAARACAPVSRDGSGELAQAMAPARWVVGGNSYALVIAAQSGRQAVSILPDWAPTCVLPHAGIVHLRDAIRAGSVASSAT